MLLMLHADRLLLDGVTVIGVGSTTPAAATATTTAEGGEAAGEVLPRTLHRRCPSTRAAPERIGDLRPQAKSPLNPSAC